MNAFTSKLMSVATNTMVATVLTTAMFSVSALADEEPGGTPAQEIVTNTATVGGDSDSGQVNGSLNTNSGNSDSNNDSSSNVYTDMSDSSVNNHAADLSQGVGVAYTPGLTTGGQDTCLGSVTGGIGFAGGSIASGKTVIDENCVRIKNAKLLGNLGFNNAAVALLIQDDNNLVAFYQSYPKIVEQLGYTDRAKSLVIQFAAEAKKKFLSKTRKKRR